MSETTQQNVIIELQNATYYYKTFAEDGTAVQDIGVEGVTLSICEGDFVALVGHNGCGKSTLAKLLNGLLRPTNGKVLVYGIDTADKKCIFDIRKSVGMVFQNPDNQRVASIVEEDVAFGPENLGVPSAEIRERVYKALEQVNMVEFAHSAPSRLSGGQKQRIAIAGALAIQPKVLVLDESTAMLDPLGRKEVLAVAHQLNKQGMTVILITHFMEEVLDANKVIVMNNGHVVSQGTPMEIFTNTKLLEEVGLRAPRAVQLSHLLHQAGFAVTDNNTDIKMLGGEVCQELKR